MSVERVIGKTVTEALNRARARLGEGAEVIEVLGHPEGVEVVCELPAGAAAPAAPAASQSTQGSDLRAMRRELASLRAQLDKRLRGPLAERLKSQRVPAPLARVALQSAGTAIGAAAFTRAEHALASRLEARLPTAPRAPNRIALVGPTGVGKTTTAAKLAAWAAAAGKSVGLIGCDRHRAGADDQLRVLATRLGVPLTVAGDGPSLRAAMDRFDDRDLVVVDTAGAGAGLPLRVEQLRETLCAVPELAIHLVLAAPTELTAQEAAWRALAPIGLRAVTFTKLDEAAAIGPLLGLLPRVALSLAWFGDGTELTDLSPGTVVVLVRRALGVRAVTRKLRYARV